MATIKLAAALKLAEERNLRFVNLQFTDVVGLVKSVTIPGTSSKTHRPRQVVRRLLDRGLRPHRRERHVPRPDLSTFALIPWERGQDTPRPVICDVYTPDGEPFPGDPRYVLPASCEGAEALGYRFNTGPELEFFLLQRNDGDGRSRSPTTRAATSTSPPTSPPRCARRWSTPWRPWGSPSRPATTRWPPASTRSTSSTTTPSRRRTTPSPSATPSRPWPASSGCTPPSCPSRSTASTAPACTPTCPSADLDTGRTSSPTPTTTYGLSDLAKRFIAGVLDHARGMSAVLAPLVNSYKRLVPGYEAPVYVSWARVNRSALIRVPKICRAAPSARIELRCPDPSCNPYLAFAVMLRAGLDGDRAQPPRPTPVEENLYQFDAGMLARHNVQTCPARCARRWTSWSGTSVCATPWAPTSTSASSRPSARSGTTTACGSPRGRSSATWSASRPASVRVARRRPRGTPPSHSRSSAGR